MQLIDKLEMFEISCNIYLLTYMGAFGLWLSQLNIQTAGSIRTKDPLAKRGALRLHVTGFHLDPIPLSSRTEEKSKWLLGPLSIQLERTI